MSSRLLGESLPFGLENLECLSVSDSLLRDSGIAGLKNDDSEEEESRKEQKDNKMVVTPETESKEHKLQFTYGLWFSRRQGHVQSYDQKLKLIGTFNTVEQYWSLYSYLVRPSELGGSGDFHLFKHGIKPMWEDEANRDGGKWIVRLRKGLASRCWENLILAILGEQFMVGEEICGAVISIRYQEDIISVWNKTSSDQATTIRIRDTLKRVLNLPPNTIMEYKTHNNSLRDNTSFRNTDVFVK